MCACEAVFFCLKHLFTSRRPFPYRMSKTTSFSSALSATPEPKAAGFSPAGLTRLHATLRADVDAGVIPGAVALVMRAGRLAFFESFGYDDRNSQRPMHRSLLRALVYQALQ
jgi:Beta-lactamase